MTTPFAPPNDLLLLERAVAERNDPRSQFWKVPGAGHVLSMTPDPEIYRAPSRRFSRPLKVRRQRNRGPDFKPLWIGFTLAADESPEFVDGMIIRERPLGDDLEVHGVVIQQNKQRRIHHLFNPRPDMIAPREFVENRKPVLAKRNSFGPAEIWLLLPQLWRLLCNDKSKKPDEHQKHDPANEI